MSALSTPTQTLPPLFIPSPTLSSPPTTYIQYIQVYTLVSLCGFAPRVRGTHKITTRKTHFWAWNFNNHNNRRLNFEHWKSMQVVGRFFPTAPIFPLLLPYPHHCTAHGVMHHTVGNNTRRADARISVVVVCSELADIVTHLRHQQSD